jgi:hypothetical protein
MNDREIYREKQKKWGPGWGGLEGSVALHFVLGSRTSILDPVISRKISMQNC